MAYVASTLKNVCVRVRVQDHRYMGRAHVQLSMKMIMLAHFYEELNVQDL